MRSLSLAVLVLLSACRSERSVGVTTWMQGTVKTPPAGIIQLMHASASLEAHGRTIVEGSSLYLHTFGERSVAIRNDGVRGIMVALDDGRVIDLRTTGCTGDALLPPSHKGIDCWNEHPFSLVRFDDEGAQRASFGAPPSACPGSHVSFGGYYDDVPIAVYDCKVGADRMCRAVRLDGSTQPFAEQKAQTDQVGCIIVLSNELHGRTQVLPCDLLGH